MIVFKVYESYNAPFKTDSKLFKTYDQAQSHGILVQEFYIVIETAHIDDLNTGIASGNYNLFYTKQAAQNELNICT